MIHALILGNNYPHTSYSLPDCVLDAENVSRALAPHITGQSIVLRDDECTLANIQKSLGRIKAAMKRGDALLGYNSGHGTTEGKRQGIVLARGVVWWEANIRSVLRTISPAIFISDSCFAGGLPRARGSARFVPFAKLQRRLQPQTPSKMPQRQYDYLAACAAGETAASTGDGGAFTNVLIEVFRDATPRYSMKGIYNRIRQQLPSDEYDQTPQFFASDKGFSRRTLGSFLK